MNTVSCAAPGTCAIGGSYTDGKGRRQAFAANEASGAWRGAVEVPGTSALNVKGSAEVDAVDCPVAGDCTAAGDYLSKSGAAEFFVSNATGGTWRGAIPVPGLASLGIGADLSGTPIAVVSCTPTTCEIGGTMSTNLAGDDRLPGGRRRHGGRCAPGAGDLPGGHCTVVPRRRGLRRGWHRLPDAAPTGSCLTRSTGSGASPSWWPPATA